MFEELMNDFINKRNNYIDELSINLLKRAGVPISENATNFELIMVYNDLQKRGLRLKMSKTHDNKDMLAVYRIEDLHDSLLYGYIFETRVELNRISIIAIPVQ